jgi:predicted HTH domain antitoxin
MEVTLTIPDELARALPLPAEEQQARLQTEMACLLYAKGWLSYGQAVRLSGLDHYRFGLELGDRNIPRHYSEAEIDHDLEYANRQQHVARL